MSFKCKLFGHKFAEHKDTFSVTTKRGAKLEIQTSTCEKCGKKSFKIIGDWKVEFEDGKSVDFNFSFQPDIKGQWNVR